jgi:hypothetical protein
VLDLKGEGEERERRGILQVSQTLVEEMKYQTQVLVQSPVVQVMLVLGQLYTLLMYQK